MELRQHLGFLLLLIFISFMIWTLKMDWEDGYTAWIPLGGGVVIWAALEVVYWIFVFLIV